MALAFGPIGSPDLKRHSFRWGPICAVMPPHHPLATHESVTIEQLADQRLIALTENFGLQRHMNAMFQSRERVFTPAYRCNLFATAMSLSQAGLGIAFMTEYAAHNLIAQGGTRRHPNRSSNSHQRTMPLTAQFRSPLYPGGTSPVASDA